MLDRNELKRLYDWYNSGMNELTGVTDEEIADAECKMINAIPELLAECSRVAELEASINDLKIELSGVRGTQALAIDALQRERGISKDREVQCNALRTDFQKEIEKLKKERDAVITTR
jgi:predicted  nucleic acid-binding Zn-ribbon protein